MVDFSNSNDVIDIRDVISRFEELEDERKDDDAQDDDGEGGDDAQVERYDGGEFETLKSLLDDLAGEGGDHEWRGVWYPVTLIRDSYFREYAEELAGDIGAIKRDAGWPLGCIDWEKAAQELQIDYGSVEYDGVTYWYR